MKELDSRPQMLEPTTFYDKAQIGILVESKILTVLLHETGS